jgi:hypothetical protein
MDGGFRVWTLHADVKRRYVRPVDRISAGHKYPVADTRVINLKRCDKFIHAVFSFLNARMKNVMKRSVREHSLNALDGSCDRTTMQNVIKAFHHSFHRGMRTAFFRQRGGRALRVGAPMT